MTEQENNFRLAIASQFKEDMKGIFEDVLRSRGNTDIQHFSTEAILLGRMYREADRLFAQKYGITSEQLQLRENKVHTPEVHTGADIYIEGRGFVTADYIVCPVCNRGLARIPADVNDNTKYYPNYCPNCGARLKEDVKCQK